MAAEREDVTLRSGQARKFREIKAGLEESLGYEPTNTRVIGHLLEHYDGPHWRGPRRTAADPRE